MEPLSFGVLCLIGLVLLAIGGELLTLSASRLATAFGVRQIIIGLTVVSFGTSMPEAFVSAFASFDRQPDIAVANVVGSNIFNLLFILGTAAVIRPLKVEVSSLKREVPFVIGTAFLVWALAYDREISRMDGVLFLIIFVLFLWWCFRKNPPNQNESVTEPVSRSGKGVQIFKIVVSLIVLVVGARLLLSGATGLARLMGFSEIVIGLTIVAAGTSFPELATSVMASVRGKDDIAVGNVTGSNIFNILFILGISALVFPLTISDSLFFRDIPIMVGASLLALPILKSGYIISRIEGGILIILYLGYIMILIRDFI
ncbi:MAG: sodium:calcium antiporter [Nitrospinaceae bacterium]|nr:MAG: sodium:calcium antiporter [Nitrospinaceae bacterium]